MYKLDCSASLSLPDFHSFMHTVCSPFLLHLSLSLSVVFTSLQALFISCSLSFSLLSPLIMPGHVGDEQDVFSVILLMSRSPRQGIKLLAHTRLSLVFNSLYRLTCSHHMSWEGISYIVYGTIICCSRP